MTRVGPTSPMAWKMITLAAAAASRPEYSDRERDRARRPRPAPLRWRLAPAAGRDRSGSARSSRRAIAQVGQHQRRVAAKEPRPEGRVERPAERRAKGHREPDRRPGQLDADAGGDDDRPRRGTTAPRRSRAVGLRVSTPMADGDHGGEDRGRGDEQRGVAGRDGLQPHRPQDLVHPEPEAAEEDDATSISGRGSRIGPSDQRRNAKRASVATE